MWSAQYHACSTWRGARTSHFTSSNASELSTSSESRSLCNCFSRCSFKSTPRKGKTIWQASVPSSSTSSTSVIAAHVSLFTLAKRKLAKESQLMKPVQLLGSTRKTQTLQIKTTHQFTFLPSTGSSRSSLQLGMETTLEKLRRSTSFQYCWSSSAWLSSRSSWDQSRVFSAHLTTSTIWSSKSLTHWICGSRKLRSQTSLSTFSRHSTTTSGNTWNKRSSTTSIW